MNHDVIEDRYARLFEIPHRLGDRLAVQGYCLDYRFGRRIVDPALRQTWHRCSVPGTLFVGWLFSLLYRVRKAKPDCVMASSDCLHVILGALVARLTGARFVADLYDDYSAFGMARIPGVGWLYSRALGSADGITAVSTTLAEELRRRYPDVPVLLLESTIDSEQFAPRGRQDSLDLLGIGELADKKLVGISGGLDAHHGTRTVFQALPEILAQDPQVVVLVAGRLFADCPLPDLDRVRYLGVLPHAHMSNFFSVLDVAVVALSNTRFGRYAFPQKAYEVLACRVPVAAADVGALSALFAGLPQGLYDPDSSTSLARAVIAQVDSPALLDVSIPTWDDQAGQLCSFLELIQPGTLAQ